MPSLLPTLAVTPKPMVAVVTRIFLQYQDKDDRGTVKALGNALGSYGKVQGTEYVTQPTTGDVRYFYPEDADKAAQIRAATQTFFNKQGSPLKIALRYPRGLTSKVARGWIEVWIPSLKAAKSEPDKEPLNLPRDLKQRPSLPNVQQSKPPLDGYGKTAAKKAVKKG